MKYCSLSLSLTLSHSGRKCVLLQAVRAHLTRTVHLVQCSALNKSPPPSFPLFNLTSFSHCASVARMRSESLFLAFAVNLHPPQ